MLGLVGSVYEPRLTVLLSSERGYVHSAHAHNRLINNIREEIVSIFANKFYDLRSFAKDEYRQTVGSCTKEARNKSIHAHTKE